MKTPIILAALAAAFTICSPASAQVEEYRDYTLSDTVSSVTTVRVNTGMIDYYLEGLRRTWVRSNEIQKELGHLQSYAIYVSDLPSSGGFNVILVVNFANTADLAPNRARYEAFMRRWGAENQADSRRTQTQVYPDMRTITGEYNMRLVTFSPPAP